MKPIVAYHAGIGVTDKDGEVCEIQADMDDFYSDEDVLRSLAEGLECRTVGEIVEALRVSKEEIGSQSAGVIQARVVKGSKEPVFAPDDEVV